MDRVINRGPDFLLRVSTLMESQSIMDRFTDWGFSVLHSLQTAMDSVITWLVSLISCLGATINPILEKLTGHGFNVKDNSCDEVGIGGVFLTVVGAVGMAVAAIVLVWLLWMVTKVVVWLLWMVIKVVVWLLWMVIKVVVCFVRRMIKAVYRCCCRRGRTMKAPGRNCRILRDNFERNPKAYFRNLRSDPRNVCLV